MESIVWLAILAGVVALLWLAALYHNRIIGNRE